MNKALKQVLDEFENRYALKGKKIKTDGIVEPEIFSKTKPKILWILKEFNGGNDTEKGDILYDLIDCVKNKNLGKYYKTYELLIKTSWLILRNNWSQDWSLSWENLPDANVLCSEILPKIAVINVKKICGKGTAKEKEIRETYKEFKDLLLKQISLIDADIIINASHVEELFNDLTNLELKNRTEKGHPLHKNQTYWLDFLGKGSGCFTWAKNENKVILQVYHPEGPKSIKGKEEYVRAILKCLADSDFKI